MTLILTPPYQAVPLPDYYLNPLDKKSTCVLSNGNLTATTSDSAYAAVRANRGISSGILLWEVTVTNVTQGGHYVYHSSIALLSGDINLIPGYNMPGSYTVQNNELGAVAAGVYSCTLDMDSKTFTVLKNGVQYGTRVVAIAPGTYYPVVAPVYGDMMTVNFGDTPFQYHQK